MCVQTVAKNTLGAASMVGGTALSWAYSFDTGMFASGIIGISSALGGSYWLLSQQRMKVIKETEAAKLETLKANEAAKLAAWVAMEHAKLEAEVEREKMLGPTMAGKLDEMNARLIAATAEAKAAKEQAVRSAEENRQLTAKLMEKLEWGTERQVRHTDNNLSHIQRLTDELVKRGIDPETLQEIGTTAKQTRDIAADTAQGVHRIEDAVVRPGSGTFPTGPK